MAITEAFVAELKKHYDDGIADGSLSVIHDWRHISTVANDAKRITRSEGGSEKDAEIAFLAGLLHDYCREPDARLKREGREDEHEKTGAEAARKILSAKGFPKDVVEAVANAILTHSFGISVKDDRGEREPDSLPALALKVADKHEQCERDVVWRRAVFFGESTGGGEPDAVMLAYCRKRESKMEAFLKSDAGRLLLKHYPKADSDFGTTREFNARLEKEVELAKKDAKTSAALEVIGALGIMRLGQEAGAKAIPARAFQKDYAAKLAAYENQHQLTGELKQSLAFSKKMLAITTF